MTHDAEKRGEDMIQKLRKLKGFCPLTQMEADAAYDASVAVPISPEEVDSLVDFVTSGTRSVRKTEIDLGWTDNVNLSEIEEEILQLNRNKSKDDSDTSDEDALREELLNDDEDEIDWMAEKHRLLTAGKEADVIVEQLKLVAPIDPLRIIQSEKPFLFAGGRNFGDRYDGMLEYHKSKNRFLLFYNTKYDSAVPTGTHHPRTRFSISHELGHYFLEKHRSYLMRSQNAHLSSGEFRSDLVVEKEADSFAASILLPTKLVRPIVNKAELSVSRIKKIAGQFNASLVCTMFRSVALSDFPCAVAGIRRGEIAWMFPSDALIEAGIYPGRNFLPTGAQVPWAEFQLGVANQSENRGQVSDWFNIYDNDELEPIPVSEEYIPVVSMNTLLVLLTVDEKDVLLDEDEQHENN